MDVEISDSDIIFDKTMADPKWFALQTLSNQENKVKSAIEMLVSEKSLGDIVKEILVPSEKIVDVKNGKKYSRTRKFYPGYVFIKMCMYNDAGEFQQEIFSLIKNTKGVVRFVGKNREPVALKQNEIDDVLNKVSAVAGKVAPRVAYEIGDVIKINDGPFLNLTGTIEGIDTEQGRLRVNVSMFGRSTPVDLEFWQVKRFVDGED